MAVNDFSLLGTQAPIIVGSVFRLWPTQRRHREAVYQNNCCGYRVFRCWEPLFRDTTTRFDRSRNNPFRPRSSGGRRNRCGEQSRCRSYPVRSGAVVGLRLRTPAHPGDKAVPSELRRRETCGRTRIRSSRQTRGVSREAARHIRSWTYATVRTSSTGFPSDHPADAEVISMVPSALGKTTRGCGSCHLPNGKGRPENAGVAGLPVAYFMRQIQDFRNGLRHTADPRKPNTQYDDRTRQGDDRRRESRPPPNILDRMKWTPWIRVVETDLVPKTRIAGNLFLPARAGEDRADRRTHHRDAGERRAGGNVSQPALGIRCLCAGRQHQER